MDAGQPFLPQPEPQARPAQPRRYRRMVITWLILVVMFIGIWQLLDENGTGQGGRVQSTPDTCTPSFWVTSAPILFVALLLLVSVLWFSRKYGDWGRFNLMQEPARLAAAQGRFADAVTLMRELAQKVASKPPLRAVAQLNLAEDLLWCGQVEEALQMFAEVERNKLVLFSATTRLSACAGLAMAYVLRNDLTTAQLWLNEARQRLAKSQDDRIAMGAKLCWVQAVMLCKMGSYADVGALLERDRSYLMAAFGWRNICSINLLRVFAATKTGQPLDEAIRQWPVRVDALAVSQFQTLMAPQQEVKEFLRSVPLD